MRVVRAIAIVVCVTSGCMFAGDGDDEDGGRPPPPAGTAPSVIGAPHELDKPMLATPGTNALDPAIAFDGTNYLVVWADARKSGVATDIWAERVDAGGHPIDPAGIAIAIGPGNQSHPAVVFDGTRYLVAWEDYKVKGGTEADLGAAFVSVDGVVTPLPAIAATTDDDFAPALAAGPGGVAATWMQGPHVMAAPIVDGIAGTAVALTSSALADRNPQIAAGSDGQFLVTYVEMVSASRTSNYAQLVTPALAPAGAAIAIDLNDTATAKYPSVMFDGTDYLVAYSRYSLGADLYATRITTAGTMLDTHVESAKPVGGKLIEHAASIQDLPAIACGPVDCVVVWQDIRDSTANYDLYARRLSLALDPIGGELVVAKAPHMQSVVRVAASNDGYLAVWQDARAGNNAALRVVGSTVSSLGVIGDNTVLDVGYNAETAPALAATTSGAVIVAWEDSRTRFGDAIVVAPLADKTGVTTADPFPACVPEYTQQFASASTFGDGALVTWTDNRSGVDTEIYAARIDATGRSLDPMGLVVSADPTSIKDGNSRVASDGTTALVVWENSTATNRGVVGAFVHADGTVDPQFVISDPIGSQQRPDVAWNAHDGVYIVVWQDGRLDPTAPDIEAARVAPDGTVLDPDGIVLAHGDGSRGGARIAIDGDTGIVVYGEKVNDQWDVFAQRFSAVGALAVTEPRLTLTSDPDTQSSIDVTAVGHRFFAVWNDAPADGTTRATGTNIYGRAIPPSGVLTESRLTIAGDAEDESTPSVVATSPTHAIVAYTTRRTDLDATRATTRTIDFGSDTCPGE